MRPSSPRKNKKWTPTFQAGLNRSIVANPAPSMEVMAARQSVSTRKVSKTIKGDLGVKDYISPDLIPFDF